MLTDVWHERQSRGDETHNLITVVMNQIRTDLDGAIKWIIDLHNQKTKEYFELLEQVRTSWGNHQLDGEVAQYIIGLGNLVRACSCYSFEVRRLSQRVRRSLTKLVVHIT